MRPLRVILTSPWATCEGGAEQMLWDLLSGVDRSRVRLEAVFLEHGPMHEQTMALGLRSHVVPVGRLRDPYAAARAVSALAGRYRRSAPDLLVHWMSKAQIYGSLAATLAGAGGRSVWWQHAVTLGSAIDRVATALPARAIGTSSRIAAEAQARVWPHSPTFTVYPGSGEHRPSAIAVANARERIGPALRPTTIVCVARLQPWKGQHHLISAVARLVALGHDVGLVLVGGTVFGESNAYEQELQASVAEQGLEGRVYMAGQVDDAAPYLALADIFVSASDVEPFGIALVEAMAAGLPIVAVRAGGPREILEDGRWGIMVERPDPALLSAALEGLLGSAEAARETGERGRARYEAQFTTDAMCERFSGCVEDLVGRSGVEKAGRLAP